MSVKEIIMRLLAIKKRIFYTLVVSFLLVNLGASFNISAFAQETIVEVSSATAAPGQQIQIPVTVKNITAETGLCAYDFQITYDISAFQVNNVNPGDPPFSSFAAVSVKEAIGTIYINAIHTQVPGPIGSIIVARINLTAISVGNWPINVNITTLADVNGSNVAAVAAPGTLTVSGAPVGTVPAIPSPTSTQAPPQPTATATASVPTAGTSLEVGSATLSVGTTARIPITVKNISAPSGFGAYDFNLSFKPEGVRVDKIEGANEAFGALEVANVNNSAGWVYFNDYTIQVPGPKGDVIVAYVTVRGMSPGRWPLEIKATTLSASNGDDIPAVLITGNIAVRSTSAPPPPPTTPLPWLTPIPMITATPTPTPTPVPMPSAAPTSAPTSPPTAAPTAPVTPEPVVTSAPRPVATPTAAPAPVPSPTPEPPASQPRNWPLIIGIAALAIGIIIVLVFFLAGKKPSL